MGHDRAVVHTGLLGYGLAVRVSVVALSLGLAVTEGLGGNLRWFVTSLVGYAMVLGASSVGA